MTIKSASTCRSTLFGFQNTDDDEAVKVDAQTEDGTLRTKVSIKREHNFTRSGPEIADEVEFFSKHCYTDTYL